MFAGYHTTSYAIRNTPTGLEQVGDFFTTEECSGTPCSTFQLVSTPGKQTYSSLFQKPASYDNCTPSSPIGAYCAMVVTNFSLYFDGALPAGESADWRLTITGVPESATWAMMILGFGIAGAAIRRKTARSASPARA